MNKKGQGIAIDLMAAVLIFLIIGGSIMLVWGDKAFEAEERLFENERIAMTERTLDTMIKSNGLPTNWEESGGTPAQIADSIQMLGLAKRNRVLDVEKVEKFAEISTNNYAIVRTKLLIGGNDYYFRILDPDDMSAAIDDTTAGTAPGDDVIKIRISRPVVYTYTRPTGTKQYNAIAELTLYSENWRK